MVAGLGRRGQRRELCAVGFANIGAAAALIGASRHSSEIGGRLLLAASLEVATFAGSQALALGLSEKRAA